MKRSERLTIVVEINQKKEEKAAEELAAAFREVKLQEGRLIEFEVYRGEYGQQFSQQASNGMDASRLREYQAFISRINTLLIQQKAAIESVKLEYEDKKRQWLAVRNRLKALNKVQDKHLVKEKIREGKIEQRELDDHVIRKFSTNMK